MPTIVHFQRPKPLEVLSEPMIMSMTMAQLYGTWSKGEPNYSRPAAEMFLALDAAITKAAKRNPQMKTDDAMMATLGIVQKLWDQRMNELRSAAREPKPIQKRRQKSNRLTGFLR